METSPLPVKGFEFLPIPGTHGGWAVLSVPHLPWHESSVSNGHLRGPLTLAPVAEHLAVELLLSVCLFFIDFKVYRDRGLNHDLPHARWTLYHWATAELTKDIRLYRCVKLNHSTKTRIQKSMFSCNVFWFLSNPYDKT